MIKPKVVNFLFLSLGLMLLASCVGGSEETTTGGDPAVTPAPPSSAPPADSTLSCGVPIEDQPDGRFLGMDILNLTEDGHLNGQGFTNNINRLKAVGGTAIALHLPWNFFETTAGSGTNSGTLVDPVAGSSGQGTLSTFIDVLQGRNLKMALTINPIDIPGVYVPSDLATLPFNHPNMLARFNKLLDFVLSITGSDGTTTIQSYLTSLQMGNEINGFDTTGRPASVNGFWSDYGEFLFSADAHLQTINRSIKSGFTITHGAVHSGFLAVAQAFAGVTDIVGVTYYPLNNDFTMKDPSVAGTDFQDLVNAFPGRTIYMQEVGYSTSTTTLGSERKQAQFFCNVFKAWDTYKTNIPFINIVRHNDIPEFGYNDANGHVDGADDLAGPYGIGTAEFTEYLRTLGLRSFNGGGTNKEAYNVVSEEMRKRNFY